MEPNALHVLLAIDCSVRVYQSFAAIIVHDACICYKCMLALHIAILHYAGIKLNAFREALCSILPYNAHR